MRHCDLAPKKDYIQNVILFILILFYVIMSLIIIWEEIILNDVKLKDLYMGLPDGEVEARDKRFQELFFDPNNKYN